MIIFRSELNKVDDEFLGWGHVLKGRVKSNGVGGGHHVWQYPYVKEFAPVIQNEIIAAEEEFNHIAREISDGENRRRAPITGKPEPSKKPVG